MLARTSTATRPSNSNLGELEIQLHLAPAFGLKATARLNKRQVLALHRSLRSGNNIVLTRIHYALVNFLYKHLCTSFNLYQDDEVRDAFVMSCISDSIFRHSNDIINWNLTSEPVRFLENQLIEQSAKIGVLQ